MDVVTRPAIPFLQIDLLGTAHPITVVVPSLLAVFVADLTWCYFCDTTRHAIPPSLVVDFGLGYLRRVGEEWNVPLRNAVGGICPGEGTLRVGGILVHLCSSKPALTLQTCTISFRTPRIHRLHILAFSLTRLELAPVYRVYSNLRPLPQIPCRHLCTSMTGHWRITSTGLKTHFERMGPFLEGRRGNWSWIEERQVWALVGSRTYMRSYPCLRQAWALSWCIPQSVETPVRCGVLDSPCYVRRLWITVLLQVLHVQMFFLGGARSSVLDAVFRDGKRDVSSL